MRKIKDLCVVQSTFMDGTEERKKYERVGAILEGQYGELVIVNATFNPAGVPPKGRLGKVLDGAVILYAFDDRRDGQQKQSGKDPLDDDIPF